MPPLTPPPPPPASNVGGAIRLSREPQAPAHLAGHRAWRLLGGRLAWDEMSAPGSRGEDDILTAHGDAPPLSYLKQDPRLPASEAEAGVSGVVPPHLKAQAPPHPHPQVPGSELGLHPLPRL